MKNDKLNYLLCLLFFVVLAAITFRCAWGADHVFSASDLNIGRLAFKKSNLPASLTGYFTANQVMGSSGYGFTLFNVLLAALPLVFFANTIYGLILVGGSLAMVWFLRLWNRSWLASVFGALVSFWVNSVMLASGGHAYKMEVLAFSVLGLCLVEKAVRSESIKRTIGFSICAGLAVGIMIIEQQDVALLAGLFVGSYSIFRLVQAHGKAGARWLAVLAPVGIVAILLAGSTAMKSYKSNIAGAASVQGDSAKKWNYITQWSLVPSEWPDLIASGWGGWSSNNPEGPYWGKLGQSAEWETSRQGFRNFKLTSNYFGIIPFLLGAFGIVMAVRNRKNEEGGQFLFWAIAGLLGLWLAFGKYSILYKLFYQLPMLGNIRAPIKLLDNFQICLGIVSAYGLDRLLADGKGGKILKVFWLSGAALAGMMLLAGLKLAAFPDMQKAAFSELGFGNFADVMVQNMFTAWFHAALLALVCAGLIFMVWKGIAPTKWVIVAFITLMTVDSLILTSHYFKADDITPLRKGNALITYLEQHQGNERSFFVDQGGIYNQWLASDGPFHDLNLFNIWQMPRMPLEYKEYLGKVGKNQIRLWELSSIKHVAAPAGIMEQLKKNPELGKRFKTVLNYQVPTAQGMRPDVLLELSGAVPRFALYQGWDALPLDQHCDILASPQHDFSSKLLVDSEAGLASVTGGKFMPLDGETSKKSAKVEVNASGPSIVRFSQRIQPGWNVRVDGKPAKLIRVDYLCMGVAVPAGQHTVEFRCVDGKPPVFFSVAIMVLSLGGGIVLVRKGNVAE